MMYRALIIGMMFGGFAGTAPGAQPAGSWPEPRHDSHLTSVQPLAGRINRPPRVIAELPGEFAESSLTSLSLPNQRGAVGVAIVDGALNCYNQEGRLRWSLHPPGLNFTTISASGDLAGDGRSLIALQAGRPTAPLGAVALVSADDGKLLWRYDVEPMSYAWYLHIGHYLPHSAAQQLVVLMQGYPPDKKFGYIALFDFAGGAKAPTQKWRYDFDHYTCFPSLLTDDLDGDGIDELVVECHSRMWFLDAFTGRVKQFAEWDVSPANIRSYGLVQFADLNGDGRKDFFCIANFAQHHEVLLNANGKMTEAWHRGWPESVTIGHVATCYPLPAHGDIDGNGKQSLVVSMFNSENEHAWLTLVYDAVSGTVKYRLPGVIASTLVRVGRRDLILAEPSSDPGAAQPDGSHRIDPGAALSAYGVKDGKLVEVWRDAAARAVRTERADHPSLLRGDKPFMLADDGAGELTMRPESSSPQKPILKALLPADVSQSPSQLLAADLLGEGRNQLLVYRDGSASLYRLSDGKLRKAAEYPSTALPVVAELEADGRLDLVLCDVSLAHQPMVRAVCPSEGNRVLWSNTFPPPAHPGLPKPRPAYLRAGHFTGRKGADVYCWFAEPSVRSAMVDGHTGKIVWEQGDIPSLERHIGPSMNLAAVAPFDGLSHDDLIFTNPDYYCIASGTDGKLLLGPISPQKIFNQPSQGLYTFPAVLDSRKDDPTVCLVGGHYFQGAMTLHANPLWYKLPEVGEARSANEGFLRLPDGQWLMGFGRQNGKFACVNVADGRLRWELDTAATCTDAVACDIRGSGTPTFVFATSHAKLYAVEDGGTAPRILWTADLSAPAAGAPIAGDLLGTGSSQIIVPLADGGIVVLN